MSITPLGADDKPSFLQARLTNFLHDVRTFGEQSGRRFDPSVFLLDDFAITLNESRFASNIAVGMAIHFPDEPLYLIESMINCCGVVVAEIEGRVEQSDLFSRFGGIGSAIGDHPIDFKRKNHFVSVYERENGNSVAIMHTSFSEVKLGNRTHHGLYPEEDGYFSRAGEAFVGKHGRYVFVTEDLAREFESEVAYWDHYSCGRREEIARQLFPGCDVVFNRSHVSVPKPGLTVLGGYFSTIGSDPLFLTEGPLEDAGVYAMEDFHRVDSLGGFLAPHGSGIAFDCDELIIDDRVRVRRGENWTVVDELADLSYGYNRLPRSARAQLRPVIECKITL